MRQRDLEEEKSRFRAILLSVTIHGLLFAYLVYAGFELKNKMGSGYTEFSIAQEPPKGSQLQKLNTNQDNSNTPEMAKPSPPPPAPKPKAPKKKVAAKAPKIQTAPVSDEVVAKEEESKQTPIPTPLPDEPDTKESEDNSQTETTPSPSPVETDTMEEDLKALAQELPEKSLNEEDLGGKDSVNSAAQNTSYGDPNQVRSHLELSPAAGNKAPVYPYKLQRMHIEGSVVVDYYVLPNGGIRDIRMVQASEHGEFNQSVISEVRKWKFIPGKTGYFRHEFHFRLNQPTQVIPERLKRRK